jgi:hypothetical protein
MERNMTTTHKRRMTVWVVGVIAIVALVGITKVGFSRPPRTCAVCQRTIEPHWAFKAVLRNGKTVETCCCRCGFRYVMTSHEPVRAMWATDFVTGRWGPAQDAVYVSGSRLSHCAPTGLQRDGLGCCYLKTFDRCLPSLVAFDDQDEARKFQHQYGGQIMSQTQVFASDAVIRGSGGK